MTKEVRSNIAETTVKNIVQRKQEENCPNELIWKNDESIHGTK